MLTITILSYVNDKADFQYEFSNQMIAVQNDGFQPSMLWWIQEDPITNQQQWSFEIRNGDTIGINYMYNNGVFYPETQNKDTPYDRQQTMTNNYEVTNRNAHQPAMVSYASDHPSTYTIIRKITV